MKLTHVRLLSDDLEALARFYRHLRDPDGNLIELNAPLGRN